MRLTTREKAKLYDELRSMARYERPVEGYHNGWHTLLIHTKETNTPANFSSAVKAVIKEQS